jgi:hypothetical protein
MSAQPKIEGELWLFPARVLFASDGEFLASKRREEKVADNEN